MFCIRGVKYKQQYWLTIINILAVQLNIVPTIFVLPIFFGTRSPTNFWLDPLIFHSDTMTSTWDIWGRSSKKWSWMSDRYYIPSSRWVIWARDRVANIAFFIASDGFSWKLSLLPLCRGTFKVTVQRNQYFKENCPSLRIECVMQAIAWNIYPKFR